MEFIHLHPDTLKQIGRKLNELSCETTKSMYNNLVEQCKPDEVLFGLYKCDWFSESSWLSSIDVIKSVEKPRQVLDYPVVIPIRNGFFAVKKSELKEYLTTTEYAMLL